LKNSFGAKNSAIEMIKELAYQSGREAKYEEYRLIGNSTATLRVHPPGGLRSVAGARA
jgi:hypothetical protein